MYVKKYKDSATTWKHWWFLKMLNLVLPSDSKTPFQNKTKANAHTNLYTNIHSSIIQTAKKFTCSFR